jgi:hypothetical protein
VQRSAPLVRRRLQTWFARTGAWCCHNDKHCFEDQFVIFSGGKFELRKGQDIVIKAFQIFHDKHKDALLVNSWFNQWSFSMQTMAASPYINFQLHYKPDFVQAYWNRSLAWLLSGDFQQGWREYEWRWRRKETPPPPFPQPRWDGVPFPQQTLLVYAEQGLGGTIQFVRYLARVAARGGHVVLACQPFDLHVPLLSLPGILQTVPATIPADVPYITAEPALVQEWRTRLGEATGLRVGLVWAENPSHMNDRNRSCSLAALAPLGHIPELALYSLQTGAAATHLEQPPPGMVLHDVGRTLHHFADTAAVLANLDLVITVETSVAHLAGAMGRPVWTLLPYVG